MNRFRIAGLVIAITALMLWLKVRSHPLEADIFTEQLIVGESNRTYRLVVPHRDSGPKPLVVAFHGMGDSAGSMADYTGLDLMAARNNFVLAYPEAKNSMWATLATDPIAFDDNPDLRFFDQLLAKLKTTQDIDGDRVYLVGMSNGASFVQLLAAVRTSELAAVVAHSGSKPKGARNFDHPLPIMLVVGSEDSVALSMEHDADSYRDAGQIVEFVSVSNLGHAWSKMHNERIWEFLNQHSRGGNE